MAVLTAGREQTTSGTFGKHWARYRAGYAFVLPAFVLYAIFMIYPFFNSIYLSFTDWNGATATKNFVGLDNFQRLFDDGLLWRSLRNNLIWVVVGTIAPLVIGYLLAVLLASRPKGFTLFRTAFFMPQILSPVIIGIVW